MGVRVRVRAYVPGRMHVCVRVYVREYERVCERVNVCVSACVYVSKHATV